MDIQEGATTEDPDPLAWRSWRASGELRGPEAIADAQTSAAGASVSDPAWRKRRFSCFPLRILSSQQHVGIYYGRCSGRMAKRRSAAFRARPLEPGRFSLQEANERLATLSRHGGFGYEVLVQVICVSETVERREQVFEMEREHLTMETSGSSRDSKALCGSARVRGAEQVAADLERRHKCPHVAKGTRAKLKAVSR